MPKIKLEDYLKEDEKVTEFLRNDRFWNKFNTSAQIPIEYLTERDPTSIIVGKENEIRVGKTVNYLGAQIELQREMRFADMFTLLMEIDQLKKKGKRNEIEKIESSMENHPDYDWERDYNFYLNELILKNQYDRKRSVKNIFKNLEKLVLDAEIDYTKISEKLRLELPTPPTFYLEGPLGSGKSFIQRRLMLSYIKLAKEVGIKGFDILSVRDPLNMDKPKVIKLLGGEGIKLTSYYDGIIRRNNLKQKWKERGVAVGILAFPTYFALRLGIALASYSWGLGIGVDPLADIGWWINRNGDWIRWISYISLGYKGVSGYLDKINKNKSKRPEWLSNSKNLPPVYTGSVGMKNLEGEYKPDTELPPQSWLKGSGMMTGDGKVAIIEQLPELTQDEQSWLSQLIQERELSIGGKGEHTIDMFPILYMGANPHLVKNISRPLMDRLQLGASCYVINNVDRNLNNERKLNLFLEYYRKQKNGKPITKKGLDTLLEISTALAEDKTQIEISRRYLSIIDNSINMVKAENKENITNIEVIKALKDTKSIIEQSLDVKINNHYKNLKINDEIGSVNILGYLTDKYMIKHENKDLKKEIEEENGRGYVTQIKATLNPAKEQGIELIIPENWNDKKEYYKERLSLLLGKNDYNITIDLSKVLEEDETLLSGMYLAAQSAIQNKKLNPNILVATNCDTNGNLISLSKINRRNYTNKKEIKEEVISEYDFKERLNTKLDIYPKIYKAKDLKELYEMMVK